MALPLNKILTDYLNDQTTVEISSLGDGEDQNKLHIDEDLFISRLKQSTKFSNRISVTIIIVLIAVIVFIGIVIWVNHTNKTFVMLLLGGESGGIFYAIRMLMKLKREELFSVLIVDSFQKATSESEKKRLIKTIWDFLYKK